MSHAQDWQKRALDLEQEGFSIGVIGRSGRLEDERSRTAASQELEVARALTLTIKLVMPLAESSGPSLSNSAVVRMSKLTEELLKAALRRAHASKRAFVTSEDVQGAWEELHPAPRSA